MAAGGDVRVAVKRYDMAGLRKLFEKRVLAVPEVQREFVWKPRQVCALLDSIAKGYPIGSALVWKTDTRNKSALREKLHILPDFDPSNREIWFLVDGQQRLSVLYHVLCADRIDVRQEPPIDFRRFFFYAGASSEGVDAFVYRKGAPGPGYVPLRDVLGGRRRPSSGVGSRAARRIEECRQRVLSAQFLLQVMTTRRIEAVRETFIRINTQGTRVTSADRAFARAATLKVRHAARALLSKVQDAGHIDDEVVLSVLALLFEQQDVGGRAWEKVVTRIERGELDRDEFDRHWRRVEAALPYAIDYLRGFGVRHLDMLPSTQMLALLTYFFALKGTKRPRNQAAQRLRSWFWFAGASDRYSGRGYRRYLTADAKFMRELAQGRLPKLATDGPVPIRDLRFGEYSSRSSLSRAFFCLLAVQGPRYLADGSEIRPEKYASIANRSDRHHIFPRQLLSYHGIGPREYNAIPNVCLLVARENQSIGSRAPSSYLGDPKICHSAKARRKALASHLIPHAPDSGIWDKKIKSGFERFMAQRTKAIADAFQAQAGHTVFR